MGSPLHYLGPDGIAFIPVTAATPLPVTGGGGGGGVTPVAGTDGTTVASPNNPLPVTQAQGVIASGSLSLAANTANTIIGAFAGRQKFYVLNWIQAPVYLAYGTTGTPASGAGSLFIPPAQIINGVLTPSQFEPWILPVGGMRAVCATAGDLTVSAA